jgi:cystathionine gamma-synthase
MKIETLVIHAGRTVDPTTGAVTPPIQLATTFERDPDGGYARGYSYIRPDNPTRHALETCLAQLEGGRHAICFASGSAASLAVFSLLRPDDHVIAPRECYHGTRQQLREIVSAWGVRVDFIDTTQVNDIEAHIGASTRLLWLETPSNPTLRVTDIAAVSRAAQAAGALVACDNTFATPVLQRPFELGADLVVHSSTKFFGGHSDVMGGAVIVRERDDLAARIRSYQGVGGGVPSPFDCWLIRRSLATLPCRVRAQTESALRIAQVLERDHRIERVFYPGLESDPAHVLARRQMAGYGAVLSVCVRGDASRAIAVTHRTQLFIRATSLGGVESLIEHRASVEGPGTPTPDNLLRLSVGLENVDDLVADLDQALG